LGRPEANSSKERSNAWNIALGGMVDGSSLALVIQRSGLMPSLLNLKQGTQSVVDDR